jgi:hypothetical protein
VSGGCGSALLASGSGPHLVTKRLCDVCAEVTGMSGAGIMLMSGDIAQGSLCTTDAVSARIEELQLVLGEGPCVDAYHQQRPVLEPISPIPMRCGGRLSPARRSKRVRAIFGFPLQFGAVRLGALNLYCDRPGPTQRRTAEPTRP